MGEKKWNAERGNWEIDGKPVTYTVSWTNIDTGHDHTEEFTDVDQGHSFFEQLRKSPHAISVKWDHVEP